MVDLERVYGFHPFYNEFRELNFDLYFRQTFIRNKDCAKLEVSIISGLPITPEGFNYEPINPELLTGDVSVRLNYIGVEAASYKRKGIGNELLDWFTKKLDKYNYSSNLSVDGQFKTPIDVLYKFYSSYGYIRINQDDMIRPCLTDRARIFKTSSLKELVSLKSSLYELVNTHLVEEYLNVDDDDIGPKEYVKEYRSKWVNHLNFLDKCITDSFDIIECCDTITYSKLYSFKACIEDISNSAIIDEEESDIILRLEKCTEAIESVLAS